MKRLIIKKIKFFILLILLLILLSTLSLFIIYKVSLFKYQSIKIEKTSQISNALAIFDYNQSQHNDLISSCWYDSGDYLIFLPRNVETLFYLSLAYREAKDSDVKNNLIDKIYTQLDCVENMIKENIKQFRDQSNHGINMPPKLNELLSSNNVYYFNDKEGQDVLLMIALIYKNIGNEEKFIHYKNLSAIKKTITISENCCELGPIQLKNSELVAIEYLAGTTKNYTTNNIWGLQFESLAALESKNTEAIKGLLDYIKNNYNNSLFDYLGGNYDIAGTIALEKLYAAKTNDKSFDDLSTDLWLYLHGNNVYSFDFTNPNYIYHPCYFFNACNLSDTLINGISQTKEIDFKSWQVSEVQITGQAQYILAEILYNNL